MLVGVKLACYGRSWLLYWGNVAAVIAHINMLTLMREIVLR